MTKFERLIDTAVKNPSLDGALAPLMDFLGITDGGIAAQVFSGPDEDRWPDAPVHERKRMIGNWITSEIMWMGDD